MRPSIVMEDSDFFVYSNDPFLVINLEKGSRLVLSGAPHRQKNLFKICFIVRKLTLKNGRIVILGNKVAYKL